MKAETGILVVSDASGTRELGTFTCPHCNRVGVVNKDDGGWCFKCARLVCKSKRCYDNCVPILKRLN